MQRNNNDNPNEGREWAYVPWLLSLEFKATFLEHNKARTKRSHACTIEQFEKSIDSLLSSIEVNAIKKSLYLSKNQNRSSKHYQKLKGVHKKIHNLKLANCLQILFEVKHNLDYTNKTPTPTTFYLYLYKIYAIHLYVSQILEECIQAGPSFFSLIDKGFLRNFSVLSISSISSVCAYIKEIIANTSAVYVEIASTMKEVFCSKNTLLSMKHWQFFQKCLGRLPSIETITNKIDKFRPLISTTAKPIIFTLPPLAVAEEVKPHTHPLTNTNKPKKHTEPKNSKTTTQQTSPHKTTQPIVTNTTAIPREKQDDDDASSKKRKNSEIEKTFNTKRSRETKVVDQHQQPAQPKKQSLLNSVFDSLLVGVKR